MRFVVVGCIGWLLAGSLLALPIRVEIVEPPSDAQGKPAQGLLRVSVSGEDPSTHKVSIPGEVLLDLPARSSVRLSLVSEELWAPEKIVFPSEDGGDVQIHTLPSSSLQGTLSVPGGHGQPEQLDVFFLPSDPDSDEWKRTGTSSRVREPCTVDLKGAFECRVPALPLDLHLHAPGFIPKYFWHMPLSAEHPRKLGEIPLRPGASIVGRVLTTDDLPPDSGAMVFLEPATPTSHQAERTESKLEHRERQGLVDRRGFFQLQDIAPGSYRIRVEKSGFAPTRSEPFTVYEGRETTLPEPLVVEPPVRFELSLEPPVDPYGRPWLVDLRQEGSHDIQKEPVSDTGRWSVDSLAPGNYRLKIWSGSGRYEYSWWAEDLVIETGMEPYRVDIPLVLVEGEVTLGDEPLESLVWFGGPHGERQIRIDSNEEGFFTGYLPHEGLWRVTVAAQEIGRRSLKPVEVEKPEGARSARVDLHLPDTRISGEVVDSEGQPVPEARVQAFQVETFQDLDSTTTDAEGEFELRGLAEGSIALSAQEPVTGTSSTVTQLHLTEDLEPRPVRLVLEEHQELSGRVHWQGREVAGAQVLILPRLAPGAGALSTFPNVLTDAQGRFSVRLPAQAVGASVTILPPGFALKILSVTLPQEGPRDIEVSQEGGTLVLNTVEPESRLSGQPRTASILRHDDAQVVVEALTPWTRFHRVPQQPGTLTLPMMEPGSYTYCLYGQGGPPACTSGFLPPGGELILQAIDS